MVILGRKILLISFKAKANSLTPNYLLLVIPSSTSKTLLFRTCRIFKIYTLARSLDDINKTKSKRLLNA